MTNTRADGAFDLAVNGGGVTLSFEIAGFLPVQRTLAPNWQDYETLDDVVMVPVDPNVDGRSIPTRPRRSRSSRAPRARTRTARARARCCSRRAPTATMELPDGSDEAARRAQGPRHRVHLRRRGRRGDAGLAARQQRLHVRRRVQRRRGARRPARPRSTSTSRWSTTPRTSSARRSAAPVPTGYYDRETGRVGRLPRTAASSRSSARPTASPTWTSTATTSPNRRAAEARGAGPDRRRAPAPRLAVRPRPGAVARADHALHAVGPQLALRPAARRAAAAAEGVRVAGPQRPLPARRAPRSAARRRRSARRCRSPAPDMTLNYSSDRTPGWKRRRARSTSRSWASSRRALKGIQLLIDVAGEQIEKRWCDPELPDHRREHLQGPAADHAQHHATRFRWDGLDAYDRQIQGRVTADDPRRLRLRVQLLRRDRRVPELASASSAPTPRSSTAAASCGNRSGTMDTHFFCGIPIGQTITRAIGSWDARPTHGLGGWSLSEPPRLRPGRARAAPRRRLDDPRRGAAARRPGPRRLAQSRRRRRPRRRELPRRRRARDRARTSTTSATTCARPTATSTSTTGSTATTSSASAATARSSTSRATARRAACRPATAGPRRTPASGPSARSPPPPTARC